MAHLRKCVGLVLLLFLMNSSAIDPTKLNYRLPNNVIPLSYDIKIEPHIVEGNFTFNGEVNITMNVINEAPNITLHADSSLRIDSTATNLISSNGTGIKPRAHVQSNFTDFLRLDFEGVLLPGSYSLYFKFTGNMSDGNTGVYRASYVNGKNTKTWIVATNFLPTHARKAFPCWDEPAFKARFDLSLKHFPNYTAASNMPIQRQVEIVDGKVWTTFQKTPNMPPYLIAFIVTDFNCISNTNKSLNICARRKVLPDMKFVQGVQDTVLPHLIMYTGISYALPKLDSYAISETSTDAVDNWGLAIYRESSVAIQDDMSEESKESAALLFIHELVHQLFGNLIYPAWWKYVWLKEGLAQYFHYYIGNQVFPEYDLMNTFIANCIQTGALQRDRYNTTYLNWDPKTPSEIKRHISSLMYEKGATLMHMLSNIISKEVFQEGIRIFLRKHQYAVVTSDDFWSSMQEAHNNTKRNSLNIKEIMELYADQPGFPMINVTRDYETGRINLSQSSNIPSQTRDRWYVPLNYVTQSNLNFDNTTITHWLRPNETNLVIDGANKDDWILVNVKHSGYYMVNYDETNWDRLIKYLNTDDYAKIHKLHRAQLLRSAYHRFFASKQNFMKYFELTRYLVRETDMIPWSAAKVTFKTFRQQVINDVNLKQTMDKYTLLLLRKAIREVGFEERAGDSSSTRKKREFISLLACEMGDAECRRVMAKKAAAHLKDGKYPHIAPWELCYATEENIQVMIEKRIEAGNLDPYFGARSCYHNTTFWKKYLETTFAKHSISKTHLKLALSIVAQKSPADWDWAVDFTFKNFDSMWQSYKQFTSTILWNFIQRSYTMEGLKKISSFIDKHPDRFSGYIKSVISTQQAKFEWQVINGPIVVEWLEKQIELLSKSSTSELFKKY